MTPLVYWYQWSWFGMHLFRSLFWVALIIAIFSLATPVSRRRIREFDHPLVILERRFASGAITKEEYEERKAVLQRDMHEPDARRAEAAAERRRFDRNQPA